MRKLLIFLFLLSLTKLGATPELDDYVIEGEHISLRVIYRYQDALKELYFESLAKNLDDYAGELKVKNKLTRGKIHFEIMTAIWMDHSRGIHMYRHKGGYYCWINGLLQSISEDYLKRMVAYFAHDDWASFCYNDSLISPERALAIFNKRIDSIPPPSNAPRRLILELNSASIHFQKDSLICLNGDAPYGEISYLLPFSKGTRDFVTCGETIYVIEDGEIINQVQLSEKDFTADHLERPWVEAHPKWINFRNREGFFLSYSMAENRFYKL